MSKLSMDTLKERAELVASDELLNSISGGTENACHDQQVLEDAGTATTTKEMYERLNDL